MTAAGGKAVRTYLIALVPFEKKAIPVSAGYRRSMELERPNNAQRLDLASQYDAGPTWLARPRCRRARPALRGVLARNGAPVARNRQPRAMSPPSSIISPVAGECNFNVACEVPNCRIRSRFVQIGGALWGYSSPIGDRRRGGHRQLRHKKPANCSKTRRCRGSRRAQLICTSSAPCAY